MVHGGKFAMPLWNHCVLHWPEVAVIQHRLPTASDVNQKKQICSAGSLGTWDCRFLLTNMIIVQCSDCLKCKSSFFYFFNFNFDFPFGGKQAAKPLKINRLKTSIEQRTA